VLVELNDFDFNERNFDLTTDPFFEALNLSEYNTNRNVVKSQLFQFQLGLKNGTFLIQKKLSDYKTALNFYQGNIGEKNFNKKLT